MLNPLHAQHWCKFVNTNWRNIHSFKIFFVVGQSKWFLVIKTKTWTLVEPNNKMRNLTIGTHPYGHIHIKTSNLVCACTLFNIFKLYIHIKHWHHDIQNMQLEVKINFFIFNLFFVLYLGHANACDRLFLWALLSSLAFLSLFTLFY